MSAIPESPPALSDDGRRELMARQGRPAPPPAPPLDMRGVIDAARALGLSDAIPDDGPPARRPSRAESLFSRASAELGRSMARWPCPSSAFLCPFYAAVAGALWLGLSARDGLPWLPREE